MTKELDMSIIYKRDTGRIKPDIDYIGFNVNSNEDFYFINELDCIEQDGDKYYSVEEANLSDIDIEIDPDLKDYVEWLEEQIINYEDTL